MPYREALAVQQALFDHGREQHLLLLEHPHVFTHGPRADLDTNVRCDPASVGADFVAVKRGGDITYHGPGQLVGYPIVSLPNALGRARPRLRGRAADRSTRSPSSASPDAGCLDEYPGVWVDADGPNPRKICADRRATRAGAHDARLRAQRRHRHGYMRDHIVACGIADRPVTSLAEEGIDVTHASRSSTSSPGCAGDRVGRRRDRAPGRRLAAARLDDLSPFSRGEGPGEADHVPAAPVARTRSSRPV